MKVRYKSKDGTYESTAYLDVDPFEADIYIPGEVTGVDKYTDEPVTLVSDVYGWRQV